MATVDTLKEFIPDFKVANFSVVLLYLVGVFILLIILGVVLFFVIRHMKFNKRISIYEDVEGHDNLESVGKDRAMLVKVGVGGTELLYLKKRKVYRGAYGKRMGKNDYFFVIGSDGYWYNSTLGSLKEGMNTIKINPTNVNMRYQNESLQELIKQRYDKPNWWAQYGQILVNIAFFMIVAVMFWLYFEAFRDTAPAMIQSAEALKDGAEALREAVGGLDALRGTGGFSST